MSLGSDLNILDEHIRVARAAMEASIWFHASPTYHRGFTYMVLRMAFDEARHQVPPMMVKIRCGTAKLLRFEVEDVLRRLDIDAISMAQLVFTETGPAPLVHDFLNGGPIAETCDQLRQEGKVLQFAPQCGKATSEALLPLADRECFDGFVLYLNPLQRDASHELWELLQRKSTPLWALRTVAGALGEPGRYKNHCIENPEDPRNAALAQMMKICQELGLTWTQFCLRYVHSLPNVATTIGGTANLNHLQHYLDSAHQTAALPEDVMVRVDELRNEIST